MPTPFVGNLSPATGAPTGGALVRVTGGNFRLPDEPPHTGGVTPAAPPTVEVLVGGVAAPQVIVARAGLLFFRTPKRALVNADGSPIAGPVAVNVEIRNIDDDGVLIPGETVTVTNGFAYTRTSLASSNRAAITTVTEALIRLLRSEVLGNTVLDTHTDYDRTSSDGLNIVELAELPAVVLTGPDVTENRFFTPNTNPKSDGDYGWLEHRRHLYLDLTFDVAVVTHGTAQLTNLQELLLVVLDRNPELTVVRGSDTYSYELDWVPESLLSVERQPAQIKSNVRVAKGQLVIRGVNVGSLAGQTADAVVDAGAVVTEDPALTSELPDANL